MELEVITNIKEIRRYNNLFKSLVETNSVKGEKSLRYSTPGGGLEVEVRTFKNGKDTFWYTNSKVNEKQKYYNLFGYSPDFDKVNHILVQINYQLEFRDFREGGIWARDKMGRIFLLHSGKMGGGVTGISIENIDNFYGGYKVVANHNSISKEYFLVCELESQRAFNQLTSFLKEIKKIKDILKSSRVEAGKEKRRNGILLKKYTPEFWGKRKSYFKKGKTESFSDHGAIVDALKLELEKNYGYLDKCTNNQFIDLGIDKGSKPIAIFEIKTSIKTQVLYTAIGQVLLHSNSTNAKPLKFVVFPNELSTEIEKDLSVLGIKTIRFRWINNKVKFINLDQIPKC